MVLRAQFTTWTVLILHLSSMKRVLLFAQLGEGMPDNAEDLWQVAKNSSRFTQWEHYSVLALGDTSYEYSANPERIGMSSWRKQELLAL